jgi:microcompartment protein CcmL/EutN
LEPAEDCRVTTALGLLETTGLTPALVALDVMEKSAGIRVVQAEINDFLGICLKIAGPPADIEVAIAAGQAAAARLRGRPVADVIHRPHTEAWTAIESRPEYNPLIQQDVVHIPTYQSLTRPMTEDQTVPETTAFALGFIETQGFTAVFEAIDTACKAANVEVIGKEKLGGGYVTVVIKGDVAAVTAAIDAGQQKVAGLGNLVAAHVIARPSTSVLGLLPGG